MTVSEIKFGGVTLEKSQVESTKTETVKDENGNEETKYIVSFKNGVKVAYTNSPKGSIYSKQTIEDYAETTTNSVNSLEVVGNKKQFQNYITIKGGSINGVDVYNRGYDEVIVDRAEKSYNVPSSLSETSLLSGGIIFTDKKDDTQIRNLGDKKGSIFDVHRVDM